jgi:hypothetical protein
MWCRFSNKLRMSYRTDPGLYALGSPSPESPVLVSANYKLSFDTLRSHLEGLDCWILVLDTNGINVWCAAGKGTFGTEEIVRRVQATGLASFVSHRRLILPQLGAPGVRAHDVKAKSGFHVVYGPVHARDIKPFLAADMKASDEMRRVRFGLADRLVLTPMEAIPALRKFWPAALVLLAVLGLSPEGILFAKSLRDGGPFVLLGLVAILCGAILTPSLLPWVPGRAFAVKGWLLGAAGTTIFHLLWPGMLDSPWAVAAAYAAAPSFSSYLALNFTGCTTFTSKSGVKRELRFALWFYGVTGALAAVLLFAYKVSTWGVS